MTPGDGCWQWIGSLYQNGYGRFAVSSTKHRLAHRVVYELLVGPIPEGLSVMHSCDVKDCVNPDHLSVGTHQQNMRDAATKGRLKGNWSHVPRYSKLSKADVQEIRQRYEQGEFQRVLGEAFGVSQTQIGNIVRRKDWNPDGLPTVNYTNRRGPRKKVS